MKTLVPLAVMLIMCFAPRAGSQIIEGPLGIQLGEDVLEPLRKLKPYGPPRHEREGVRDIYHYENVPFLRWTTSVWVTACNDEKVISVSLGWKIKEKANAYEDRNFLVDLLTEKYGRQNEMEIPLKKPKRPKKFDILNQMFWTLKGRQVQFDFYYSNSEYHLSLQYYILGNCPQEVNPMGY
ncbi:MAG: hypothetical protein IH600_16045 [Bacteroidetes bacterium]|nr:hypothetical protein [Bacteroidota bacterium]